MLGGFGQIYRHLGEPPLDQDFLYDAYRYR